MLTFGCFVAVRVRVVGKWGSRGGVSLHPLTGVCPDAVSWSMPQAPTRLYPNSTSLCQSLSFRPTSQDKHLVSKRFRPRVWGATTLYSYQAGNSPKEIAGPIYLPQAMARSQKRPYEVVDLTGDDDDYSVRRSAKLPRVGVPPLGLPSRIVSQGSQRVDSRASQPSPQLPISLTVVDDFGEPEVLDLTQEHDGPSYDRYCTLSMLHSSLRRIFANPCGRQ